MKGPLVALIKSTEPSFSRRVATSSIVAFNLPLKVERIQNLALCHVHQRVLARDTFPRCNPLNLRNLYILLIPNCLELWANALIAFRKAVVLRRWNSPLIPLKMNPPIFLTPETIFPKMFPPLKRLFMPPIRALRNRLFRR